jgi:hypothetical protein
MKKMKFDIKDFINFSTVQIHYIDNDLDTWTVPVKLTEDRLNKIVNDYSIDKIRLKKENRLLELDIIN